MNRLLPVLLLFAACHAPTPTTTPTAEAAADLRVQVVILEHTQAEDLAPMVQEVLGSRHAVTSDLKVVAQPEHNALVLSGTTEQIRAALDLVARLDTPPAR